jgi:FkbM family methyltransferase
MTAIVDTDALSRRSLLGRLLRAPLTLVPTSKPLRILTGEVRGLRWIPESAIHRCWMGWYERDKQRLMAKEVRAGSIFYDVGANVGFHTLLAAKLVGSGKVFSFEPSPRNLEYLRRHIALNKLHNVSVFESAVSDRDQVLHFQMERTGFGGSLSDNGGGIDVNSVTLDALVSGCKIPPPDYIKMDIEGAELLALRGAEQLLRAHHPEIFLATHGHEVDRECCELLKALGYKVDRLSPSAPNGYGELLAKFRDRT